MISVPDVIKDLYHQDHAYKNIRIHFPNGERSDICNDLIVKNSVSFKESLCSQNTLKFGLCESPVFECETVGVGNIQGMTIEVSCEVECPFNCPGAEWRTDLQKYIYSIHYGTFVVSEAKRQADMIHRKILAYGGKAAHGWKIIMPEIEKPTRAEAYTPNMGYFLAENGLNVIENVVDQTVVSWTDTITGNYALGEDDPWITTTYLSADITYKIMKFDSNHDTDYDALYQLDWTMRKTRASTYNDSLIFFNDYMSFLDREALDFALDDLYRISMYYDYEYPSGTGAYNRIYSSDDYIDLGENNTLKKIFYPYNNGWYEVSKGRFYIECPYKITLKVEDENFHIIKQRTFEIAYTPYISKKKYINDAPAWTGLQIVVPRSEQEYFGTTGGVYYLDWTEHKNLEEKTNAILEIAGLFMYFGRDSLYDSKVVDIKQKFGLTPRNSLYPGRNVYPKGVTGGKLLPKDYQSCWYGDKYTLYYGAVKCTYKTVIIEEGEEKTVDWEITIYLNGFDENSDVNSYQVYDLSNNIIIKNGVWTEGTIRDMCGAIVENLTSVTYMPVDFKGRGLPYVEPGDTFEILTASNDSITTIVLNRTLSGDQTLTDNYKSV